MSGPRSKRFPRIRRQRIENNNNVQLDAAHVTGAFPFFNPTHARFRNKVDTEERGDKAATGPESQVQYQWRSRDNRKGRHVIVVPPDHPLAPSKLHVCIKGIGRMFTTAPYWDVSWWVGVLFSVGSIIFILCALFYWLPLAYPSTAFPHEAATAGGVASFVGATLFQIGAVLLMFEAVNENRTGCFGWAVQGLLLRADPDACEHHHQWRRMKKQGKKVPKSPQQEARKWTWCPSWQELRTHYIHEVGFVANATLAIGATIFYITGIMSLPGVYDTLSQGVLWGVYWLTYLVGGVLFVISSVMYMLETQQHWWKPAPHVLGWHIGLWNLIGSVGWTLSAAFGYCNPSWCEYQSDLTLLWASAGFTIGSLILWFEAVNKYSVEVEKPKPKAADS
ncbi:uncharacterized protein HMPREF1541_08110 [Cyphellophora europaea CBS 101466]|uniref:Uncharacterized protein n=1 Tax=Cyphellophora europaea (strain CBS 101466) TaxID=1220924 RepID=W2RLC2_CYPE1|nr:uncharacterized protein HMPREF1541_08110 [Cyphellophora europaea CBS 101466]ETN37120.1 hypothetical protein HMPREF1541_08110 [Cyphellophora europaea CBS 101466]